jgi:hypothetical protein
MDGRRFCRGALSATMPTLATPQSSLQLQKQVGLLSQHIRVRKI